MGNIFDNEKSSVETDNTEKLFEDIKHTNEDGEEYWLARELQEVLQYKEWRNFVKVIDKAKAACRNTGNVENDYFVDVNKIVTTGIGEPREIDDILLGRYACYLIAQNGDSRKKVIALAQTYFAVQTRKQELHEEFEELSENQKRLAIRSEMVEHNKALADAAKKAGVEGGKDYAIFQNKGYQGLYGGMGQKEIHEKKYMRRKV